MKITTKAQYINNVGNVNLFPHTIIGDACILYEYDGELLTYEMMNALGMKTGELKKAAKDNNRHDVPMVANLEHVILSLSNPSDLERIPVGADRKLSKFNTYVLSNSINTYGASKVFDIDTLRWIGNALDDDFFILPSSVHEVLIQGASLIENKFELVDMVQQINATELKTEELLSQGVFEFLRAENKLYWFDNNTDRMECLL